MPESKTKRSFRPRRTMDILAKTKKISDLLMKSMIEISNINISTSSVKEATDKRNKVYESFFKETIKIFLREG